MAEALLLPSPAFTRLGRRFARVAARGASPSWAWVDAASIDGGPFGPPQTGYLKASPLALLVPLAAATSAVSELDADDPSGDAPAAHQPQQLLLHIVHSDTYNVPVLLLQGYHADGSLWSPDTLRAHLGAMPGVATPLTAANLTQMEHPALRTPFCCVDPCGTAALMGHVLSASAAGEMALDYLCAWWSVLAPLVGASNRAAWWLDEAEPSAPASSLLPPAPPPASRISIEPSSSTAALETAPSSGEADAADDDDDAPLAVRTLVRLVGLGAAAHLNGMHAVVSGAPHPSGRYPVLLLGRGGDVGVAGAASGAFGAVGAVASGGAACGPLGEASDLATAEGLPRRAAPADEAAAALDALKLIKLIKRANLRRSSGLPLLALPPELLHRLLLASAGAGGTAAAFRPLGRLAQASHALRAAAEEAWPHLTLSLLPRGAIALPGLPRSGSSSACKASRTACASAADDVPSCSAGRGAAPAAAAAPPHARVVADDSEADEEYGSREWRHVAAADLVRVGRGVRASAACRAAATLSSPSWRRAGWRLPTPLYGHSSVLFRGQVPTLNTTDCH